MIRVLFPDGSEMTAFTATEILVRLMGGWNTDRSIYHLRQQLASRAGLVDDPELSDIEFLHRMDEAGVWAVGYGPRYS